MADVKPPRVGSAEPDAADDEDRAQLILITGLTLAVILVAVVLLLNTVIYTENLATRGVDPGGGEAIEFRDGAVEDIAGIMYREHRTANDSDDVSAEFNASVDDYANATADLSARDGVVADVTITDTVDGFFIAQTLENGNHRSLSDPNKAGNWTVARDVNRTRDYRLTVNAKESSLEDPFRVIAERPGNNWSMRVEPYDGDGIEVFVNNESVFNDSDGGNYTIDVTGGAVNGEPISGEFKWADGVQTGAGGYDVRYENGTEAVGAYHLVVDPDGDPDEPDTDASEDSSLQPYVVDGVYSARVEVHHRTPELEYRDVVRLAPGERDG